jgi:hypothetical protein
MAGCKRGRALGLSQAAFEHTLPIPAIGRNLVSPLVRIISRSIHSVVWPRSCRRRQLTHAAARRMEGDAGLGLEADGRCWPVMWRCG